MIESFLKYLQYPRLLLYQLPLEVTIMPCVSDYPDPTPEQARNQRTAKLILHFHKVFRKKPPFKIQGHSLSEAQVRDAAVDCYCQNKNLVPLLCSWLKQISDTERKTLLGNGLNKWCRRCARRATAGRPGRGRARVGIDTGGRCHAAETGRRTDAFRGRCDAGADRGASG